MFIYKPHFLKFRYSHPDLKHNRQNSILSTEEEMISSSREEDFKEIAPLITGSAKSLKTSSLITFRKTPHNPNANHSIHNLEIIPEESKHRASDQLQNQHKSQQKHTQQTSKSNSNPNPISKPKSI